MNKKQQKSTATERSIGRNAFVHIKWIVEKTRKTPTQPETRMKRFKSFLSQICGLLDRILKELFEIFCSELGKRRSKLSMKLNFFLAGNFGLQKRELLNFFFPHLI